MWQDAGYARGNGDAVKRGEVGCQLEGKRRPMPYTRLEFLFYTIDDTASGSPIRSTRINFFHRKRTEAAMDGALSCPLLPYSSIDLASPPNDTRVSESDVFACTLLLFYNNVLLSRMWCGQLVDYVEDIRYTVQILVHITTIVLEHDVAEAHARHVQKVFRSILYPFALAHASLTLGLRDQYQMFGTRRRTIKSNVFTHLPLHPLRK